jgi:hypothetical protein
MSKEAQRKHGTDLSAKGIRLFISGAQEASMGELSKVCEKPNKRIAACASRIGYARIGYVCQIFVLPEAELGPLGWSLKAIVHHEIGHCNGWPEDHPRLRRSIDANWYDLPPEQIFEGPMTIEQLLELAKHPRTSEGK